MSVIGFLTDLLTPVNKVIDKFTSDKERLEAQAALVRLEVQLSERMLQYETQLMDARSKAIAAEAAGHGWLQRNWRPLTMLTFLCLIIADCLGYLSTPLPTRVWDIIELGLGGYVIGRSAEKVLPKLAEAFKSKGKD
ncbi:3TM-type holin [Desulfocurvibacter africanus]|uniref:3TM-type holin n=1 Tax=Desulfocurvibacter africanus TaxID=873 RepID=UPI0003FD6F35|nr:3TM-type holin [Desulfocurvibacter africanus]